MPLFSKPRTNGIIDLGTPEQKAKLFQYRELLGPASAAGVSLAPTDPSRWAIYPKRNQASQSSCVYHARAKMAGILRKMQTGEFIEYSAADYNKRSNAPDEGSYPVEAMDYLRTKGIGLEVLEPSNNITAVELTQVKQSQFDGKVAGLSLLDAYAALPAYDFDTVLSTLHATQKPMILGFYGSYAEWNQDIPTLIQPALSLGEAAVRHEVCATPNYGIYNGKEGFTIEDSWGTAGIGGTGVRFISREFFVRRNYIPALVPTSFKDYSEIGVDPAKPKVKLTRELDFGMEGPDVRDLQRVLAYEGYFPANHPGSQYFGEITRRGVEQYQTKYGIVSSGTPETTGFGRVGTSTRADINKRYK